MPDEPDKPNEQDEHRAQQSERAEGASDDEVDSERPTVSPPFDPVAFARDILKPSSPPNDAHTRMTPARGTDAQAGTARLAVAPPPAAPSSSSTRSAGTRGGEVRRQTPKSVMSLANARVPSNIPPQVEPPPRLESLTNMNAVDREWSDMELATRPPPADGPGEDPVIEVGNHPALDLDDIVGDERSPDTVRRPVPEELVKPREREMSDRVSLGDYSGALEIAERILADNPEDPTAKACAESCRTVLRQMYATRIGPLDRVPVVMVPRDQLRWLSIDHKAGFVLSLVDGVSSLEMIIDVSGMPELDTLRILSELAQQRIISLR